MAHWACRPTSTRNQHERPMVTQAWLNRIGTAVPPHDIHAEFVDFARSALPDERSTALFDRMVGLADIQHRYSFFAPGPKPRDHFLDSERFYRRGGFPSTGDRMARFEREALALAMQAIAALDIERDRAAITHLIVASCTGFTAPGLDFHIMSEAGLSPSVERTIVGFMGCFAAVNALKLARHVVRSEPRAKVLVVNLELSGLHLQEQWELEKMLSFLLFGDGCGACLVSAEPIGLALDRFHATVIPRTADLITWHIRDRGFEMHLSGQVPGRIRRWLTQHGAALLGNRTVERHRVVGRACRRPLHPRRRPAWARAAPGCAAVLARRAQGFRQHVVCHADLRARSHPARAGMRGRRNGDGIRAGPHGGNLRVPPRMNLAARSTADERMDTDCADYDDYRRCLRDLARVNTVTLTHRPTLAWLARETAGLDAFSLLDVACGHGDMLRRIRRWSDRNGIAARLEGVDLNPWSARAAREATPDTAHITYRTGDVFAFEPKPVASTSSSVRNSPITSPTIRS